MENEFENKAPKVIVELTDESGHVEVKCNTSALGAIMLLSSAIEVLAAGEAREIEKEAVTQ